MPTIGRIASKLTGMSLPEVVKAANANGKSLMKKSGALTDAGKQAYKAGKSNLGLSQQATFTDCLAVAKKQAAITAKKIKNEVQKAIKKGGLNI